MAGRADLGNLLGETGRCIEEACNAICASAGIEGFTPYHLRHTYASLMLMRGADPRYVQQQLGHESLSTTYRYYAHWIPKEARSSYADLIDLRGGKTEIPCPELSGSRRQTVEVLQNQLVELTGIEPVTS